MSFTIVYSNFTAATLSTAVTSLSSLIFVTNTIQITARTNTWEPVKSRISVNATDSCAPAPASLKTITSPTHLARVYNLGVGAVGYPIAPSTITDVSCSDTYFMYELRLTSDGSLPGFMNFDEKTMTLTVNTNDLNDEGTYSIIVYAVLINGQYSSATFDIVVILDCSTVTLSFAASISNQQYLLGSGSTNYQMP